MTINERAWGKYIKRLRTINNAAARAMAKRLEEVDIINLTQNERVELINFAFRLTQKYGEASTAVSCEMYDALAELSGMHFAPAVPADLATYQEVATSVNGTLKIGNPTIIADSVGRLVKMAGVDTTMKNAIRDGAEWAWIPQGDTCAFCITLASRGWRKASKAALKGGHAEHIHANCDCTYAIRFNHSTNVAGYDPDKYLKMYDAGSGTSTEKINALRRKLEAQTNTDG